MAASKELELELHQLLNEMQLGDRTPSQLLCQMRSLAGAAITDDALKVKWLDLLPPYASRMCRVVNATSLDELAKVADKLIATNQQQLASLQTIVAASATGALRQRDRCISRTTHPQRAGSLASTATTATPGGWCWYHQKYASGATKCQPPCAYPAQGTSSAFASSDFPDLWIPPLRPKEEGLQ